MLALANMHAGSAAQPKEGVPVSGPRQRVRNVLFIMCDQLRWDYLERSHGTEEAAFRLLASPEILLEIDTIDTWTAAADGGSGS